MRDVFREWYAPSRAEYEELWASGAVILDAGALLCLYRMSKDVAQTYLELLDALADRLWLPYQAGLEFQRRRRGEIAKQRSAYADIRSRLDGFQADLRKTVGRHSVLGSATFLDESSRKTTELKTLLQELEESHAWPPEESPSGEDGLLNQLDRLLSGKVGPRLDISPEKTAEAASRMESGVPPGCKDYHSERNPVPGDLIIWWEILQEAHAGSRLADGAIFITDDRKEDWWRIEGGQLMGPRTELTRECLDAGLPIFWMQTPEAFIRSGAEHFGWDLADRFGPREEYGVPVVAAEALPEGEEKGNQSVD